MALTSDERAQLERYRRADRRKYVLAHVFMILLIVAVLIWLIIFLLGVQ